MIYFSGLYTLKGGRCLWDLDYLEICLILTGMEIQGTEEQIDKVIIMIEQGSYIEITGIEARNLPIEEDEYTFRIKR